MFTVLFRKRMSAELGQYALQSTVNYANKKIQESEKKDMNKESLEKIVREKLKQ